MNIVNMNTHNYGFILTLYAMTNSDVKYLLFLFIFTLCYLQNNLQIYIFQQEFTKKTLPSKHIFHIDCCNTEANVSYSQQNIQHMFIYSNFEMTKEVKILKQR